MISRARVDEAHFPDQIPNFWRYTRSSFKMATTLPIPIQLNPLRCQAMTVSGLARITEESLELESRSQERAPLPTPRAQLYARRKKNRSRRVAHERQQPLQLRIYFSHTRWDLCKKAPHVVAF